MAYRHDLPRIETKEEPTLLNQTAGKYAFWTSFLVGIPASMISNVRLLEKDTNSYKSSLKSAVKKDLPIQAVRLGATAIGAYVGGMKGKEEQERNREHGKIVSDPTFWNKKILSNYMTIVVPTSLATTGAILLGAPTAGMAIGAIGSLGAIAAGVSGGFSQRAVMEREFAKAQELAQERQTEKIIEKFRSENSDKITAKDMDAIKERSKDSEGQKVNHAASLEASRAVEISEAVR